MSEAPDEPGLKRRLADAEAALRQSQQLLAAQSRAFEAAVNGESLETALDALAGAAIGRFPEARCAFYLTQRNDTELRLAAGMTSAYADDVNGFRIGENSFSCGLAVALGKAVVTPDVLTEPRWKPWLWLAERYEYRGVWSFPIRTSRAERLGTVALYFREPRDATQADLAFAEHFAHAAGIVISRHQEAESRAAVQVELQRTEERYRMLFDSIDKGFCIIELVQAADGHLTDLVFREANPAFLKQMRLRDVEGRTVAALLPDFAANWAARCERVARSGVPERHETYVDDVDRWYRIHQFRIDGPQSRLVGVVFEDVSERKRNEISLRESEERFAQFAASSTDALWVRNATDWRFEFVNPAVGAIYGVAPADVIADAELLNALILPEEREAVSRNVERVSRGDLVVQEYRIQRRSDLAFRWIRSTGFPLREADGRIVRIAAIARDVTDARLAIERQSVLLAELQHRVRNIMGMIRSMVNRTAASAGSAEDYRALLEGRLLALARVQALLTREANAGGSLRDIIESEVAAQAHQRSQYGLDGPDIRLSPKAVEVLTLAFHELATNAAKHGALSQADGRLCVRWQALERDGHPWVVLDWIEQVAVPRAPPGRRGFGSDLIEARIPYELGGVGEITIAPGGARCRLQFPVNDDESILETDAPQPATVFGGSLDMSGAPDLTGREVLIVEDDYYMAHDTAAALRGAGATILGPCPSEASARELLAAVTPTHAVLDLNLGGSGPRFEIARMLGERGVPFIFLTGYDPDVIPHDMRHVPRIQKPVPFRLVVDAVSEL